MTKKETTYQTYLCVPSLPNTECSCICSSSSYSNV